MAFNQENEQHAQPSTPSPSVPCPPVFPPLPPLPPPDASKTLEWTSRAPPLPPASATRSEPLPRRFGVRITNMLSAGDASYAALKNDHKSSSSAAMAAAQRYYHQYSYFPHPEKKSRISEETAVENPQTEAEDMIQRSPSAEEPASSAPSIKLSEYNPERTPMQPGRTIWSVSPEELTELAKKMAVMKKESAESVKKLSYAEASKRNLPGFTESRAAQKREAVEVVEVERTFKKYYGLPIIPWDIHAEEKEDSFENPTGSDLEIKPSNVLDYSQIFGLSASTPTFYPRQTTDTNDLIQLLKASFASKKVAPHMDWWPGDWKCTNCGNHVLIPKRVLSCLMMN
ncbi:hypothetical protein PHYPSEUDO_012055 [Phytophthora pseudosyringae]|uniref:Uncharacterized protein n=1 Tax=Phytophthora pseudosyringae TaxID=221518 RepID=A0A8T1VAP3_9STRA|nr:hypothetical protein PHYPSEUDO_012055 [Phytophthora pseudosyringae]